MAKIDHLANDPTLKLQIFDLKLAATANRQCTVEIDSIDRRADGTMNDPHNDLIASSVLLHPDDIQKVADYFADVFGIVGKPKNT